jgi:hypothetical protein
MVTWKVRTLVAKVQLSFRDAPVNITGFIPAEKIRFPCFFTTPFAYRLFNWDTKVLRNFGP